MITFNNVSKAYTGETKAVKHVNLQVNKGEFFALIGPSGCGKTTSLKMINRLVEPSEGSIYIEGKDIRTFNRHKLRWNIGYVLQQIGLFPTMSVAENIAIVPEMKKWGKKRTAKRIDELLEMAGMNPGAYRNRKPSELSGGEKQRVGVIRALAGDPEIILMDEPFSALDPISREQLQKDLASIQNAIQKTIVFVTHDIGEAMKMADQIAVMKEGKVVQIGSPYELKHTPADEFVKTFIGDSGKNVWDIPVKDVMETHSKHMAQETTIQSSYIVPLYVFGEENRFLGRLEPSGMVSHKLIVSPEIPLRDAITTVEASDYGVIPVVCGERLMGILSYRNIVKYIHAHRAEMGQP
ncbi:osmoprotectant transport system ATP-binding protein [Geomicrobium halophilum]|uniref:Carnitine transport ATP-binding protein OpuCA n=1 Tax=Geomicrobium halophilum TaxID=549000 RepID=A0A841PPM0_9BACL|nr:ATP-binding cassette domain-containing protein [Geomicrobium halophilum]MBB6449146.1 osmoprotectant transport system ATP-binding protein [Geomicrobium halophilum]